MKNDELDKLTERAMAIRDALPTLYLTGDGEFVTGAGTNGVSSKMAASDLLATITKARRQAVLLANTLEQIPRRKSPKKSEEAPEDA